MPVAEKALLRRGANGLAAALIEYAGMRRRQRGDAENIEKAFDRPADDGVFGEHVRVMICLRPPDNQTDRVEQLLFGDKLFAVQRAQSLDDIRRNAFPGKAFVRIVIEPEFRLRRHGRDGVRLQFLDNRLIGGEIELRRAGIAAFWEVGAMIQKPEELQPGAIHVLRQAAHVVGIFPIKAALAEAVRRKADQRVAPRSGAHGADIGGNIGFAGGEIIAAGMNEPHIHIRVSRGRRIFFAAGNQRVRPKQPDVARHFEMPAFVLAIFVHDAEQHVPALAQCLNHFRHVTFLNVQQRGVIYVRKRLCTAADKLVKGMMRRDRRLRDAAGVKQFIQHRDAAFFRIRNPILLIFEKPVIELVQIVCRAGFDIGFFFLPVSERPKAEHAHAVHAAIGQSVNPFENFVVEKMIESELFDKEQAEIARDIFLLEQAAVAIKSSRKCHSAKSSSIQAVSFLLRGNPNRRRLCSGVIIMIRHSIA